MTSAPAIRYRYVDILGRRMACAMAGAPGDPIVFLHGNPTSSYLWRNVIPELSANRYCLAPDLIGMGRSEKLTGAGAGSYCFVEHRRYLDALLEALDLGDRITLVVHDWGSALGFDWARRHADRIRGIAYMEAIVRPLDWENWPPESRPLFEALRSPAGEKLILEKNVFVERILPASVIRALAPEEMATYREPFANAGEDRRPTLDWPRQLPLGNEPADVVAIVADYAAWLNACEIPKLFINAEPGAILVGAQRDFCRGWPNQQEITVPGIHFIQEDSGPDIGRAIAAWLANLP